MSHLKDFKPSSWAIDNKTTIYLITIFITLMGVMSYRALPKEQFPDIVIPTIYVSTIYPGSAPKDIENLITKHLEKQIKSISGVKKMTSNSIENYSNIIVEFNTGVDVPTAKQKVKDAVDKAKSDLPSDLQDDPSVQEVEFSEMPIMYVNISGDYDLIQLKKYAEDLKDRIEGLTEITRVDMVGALDREIQINVDMYKMQAAQLSMTDISNAVKMENLTFPGGNINMDDMQRSLSVSGEFTDIEQIRNMVVRASGGATVYLKDVAEVIDSHKEQESYGRLDHHNVITLNIIKRSGENLIASSDKIHTLIDEMKADNFPENLVVSVTGEQARNTRITLHDLINTIIIGFILVTIILMFFMGVTNAMFVALSVPLSMCVAFLVLPGLDFSLNMIVLFSFLLGLGIVVDDAIVVIENTHRVFDNGKMNITSAAKHAAAEVFLPVLSGTATTLAPFVPLAFWGGIIGKFMKFLPITLIITLTASLIVAYIMNPVFAVSFMKPHDHSAPNKQKRKKGILIVSVIILAIAAIGYLTGSFGIGNFAVTAWLVFMLYKFVFEKAILSFQTKWWPKLQRAYGTFLEWAIQHPGTVVTSVVGLFVLSLVVTGLRQPKVGFFPKSDPNFVYVYATLPPGTSPAATDSVAKIIEGRVFGVIGDDNPIVESVITNVAIGANESRDDRSPYSNKAKVGVAFVEYAKREGQSTVEYLEKIRNAVQGLPGVEIAVDQEQTGPPTAKPINIEVSGDKFEDIIETSVALKRYLDSARIDGVEELKSDLVLNKPEIKFELDRERANREGISTYNIGNELRGAVYGIEISRFKDDNDDYPIMLRYKEEQRNNIEELKNLMVTYRDMNMGGMIRQVPISTFGEVKYASTYAGIKRKNQKRVVTLTSNVLTGHNANEVVAKITAAVEDFPQMSKDVTIDMTGEKEEQVEAIGFLGRAMLISLGLILLILVTQFNSIGHTIIILSQIVFSIIGVLLGLAIFGMDISIVMTGVGIVALAGITVRNGILLVEFIDIKLKEEGKNLHDAIVEASMIRMTPVLLTATATILGMIPLAIGFNIDFVTMFTELNPKIYLGGDNVALWGPLAWTIVFGLAFATIITLIIVPVLYLISANFTALLKRKFKKTTSNSNTATA